MAYSKQAFQCYRCPEKQEGGCPAWMELTEQRLEDGEVRITKACSFAEIPRLLMMSEHAGNVVAGEVSAMRGAMANTVAQLLKAGSRRLGALPSGELD